MTPDTDQYLLSIHEELEAESRRVRSLIGDRHWLSDGLHKEAVFAKVLTRHLPSGIRVAKAFVLSGGRNDQPSTEQDVVLIDETQEAPLFHDYGLAITTVRSVLACVAIKSAYSKAQLRDCLSGFRSVTARVGEFLQVPRILFAAYFFDESSPSEPALRAAADLCYGMSLFEHSDPWDPGLEMVVAFASGPVITRMRRGDASRIVQVIQCEQFSAVTAIANIARHVALRRGLAETEIERRVADLHFAVAHSIDGEPLPTHRTVPQASGRRGGRRK